MEIRMLVHSGFAQPDLIELLLQRGGGKFRCRLSVQLNLQAVFPPDQSQFVPSLCRFELHWTNRSQEFFAGAQEEPAFPGIPEQRIGTELDDMLPQIIPDMVIRMEISRVEIPPGVQFDGFRQDFSRQVQNELRLVFAARPGGGAGIDIR